MDTADVVVVGLGGMGSAAAYHLASRGLDVVGLDQYPRNHTNGSSHGRSRILREALGHAAYLPLIKRASQLWRQLATESGTEVFRANGLLTATSPQSPVAISSLHNARKHGINCQELSASLVAEKFPAFRLTDDLVALYEPEAGTLAPETCVSAHLDLASRNGADLRHGERVVTWRSVDSRVRIETTSGSYSAKRLVLTTGPWAPEVTGTSHIPMKVQRIVNVHFQPRDPDAFASDTFPNFAFNVPEGNYYGCPDVPGCGLKIGGDISEQLCTPATIRRHVDESDIGAYRRVLDRYLPSASGPVLKTLTCMYTNTPDRNFVVDRSKKEPAVAFACGCSGHAFKFTPVIGEVLADLVTLGRTSYAIEHLSASRFR